MSIEEMMWFHLGCENILDGQVEEFPAVCEAVRDPACLDYGANGLGLCLLLKW